MTILPRIVAVNVILPEATKCFVLLWLIPAQINNRLGILFTNKVSPINFAQYLEVLVLFLVNWRVSEIMLINHPSMSAILNNSVNKQIIIQHRWHWQKIQRKCVFIEPCISRHVLKLAHNRVDIVMTKLVPVIFLGWYSASVSRLPWS